MQEKIDKIKLAVNAQQHQVMKSNQKLLKSLCKAAPTPSSQKKKIINKKSINQSINYHERDILEQYQRRRHTYVPTQFILI